MTAATHARVTCVTPEFNSSYMIDALVLADRMWSESPTYNHMPKDMDKMAEFAYNCLADPNTFVKVALYDGKVIGFFVGSVAPHGFLDQVFAFDRLVYVDPKRRGTLAARALIDSFETWARNMKASRILLGVTTGIRTDATVRFYNKLGYNTVGALTMKEI